MNTLGVITSAAILFVIAEAVPDNFPTPVTDGLTIGAYRNTFRKNGENVQFNAASSSSITTSTGQQSQPQYITIPVAALGVEGTSAYESHAAASSESIAGSTSSVIAEPPEVFVRPHGSLPVPPHRFGFDEVQTGHYDEIVPNCGCVQHDACVGEVGAYTASVLPYTDIVCGRKFDTCCFDGPWPGSLDSFAVAAACVPHEECRRPYGVLPTDVRDFGVIAPCPGVGAVRCLNVDEQGLLQFQAAVAAIDTANAHSFYHSYANGPVNLVVPFGPGENGETTTSFESSAAASISTSESEEQEVQEILPRPVPTPQTPVLPAPVPVPAPAPVSVPVPAPVPVPVPAPVSVPVSAPAPAHTVSVPVTLNAPAPAPVQASPGRIIMFPMPAPSPANTAPGPSITVFNAPMIQPPAPDLEVRPPTPVVPVIPPVEYTGPVPLPPETPAPVPAKVFPVPTPVFPRYYGRRVPWGGFRFGGLGGGLGFRKTLTFKKGFFFG